MARRKPLEFYYDPAELDPDAPRLHIRKHDGVWELRDDADVLLAAYARLPGALDDALARSATQFSEILVRAADGAFEWSVRHNPDWEWLARFMNEVTAGEREAAD